ncbi:MAG: type II toxin-antitoxin system VapC family toxin [Acidobacteriaceae bacterium]|nr:type II toxin-antitoxin system VapC family toxin [Acidobacteriaceae bacterium]
MNNNGILLDTCAIVKYLDGSLPDTAVEHLTRSDTPPFFSVLSAWEIQLKPQLRALGLNPMRLQEAITALKLQILDLRLPEIFFTFPRRPNHRDPFDLMLIAQAYTYQLAVLTCDEHFKQYPGLHVIW